MYDWEINNKMTEKNYNIDAELYMEICRTSPQINHVKYIAFGDIFQIETKEGGSWKFKVHPAKEQ